MPDLKILSKDAIPGALEKAERYRLLNESAEAESICLDVLAAEPENQQALIMLLLAVTDRFSKSYGVSDTQAKQILTRIRGQYEHAYYSGILAERRAKAQLARAVCRRARVAHEAELDAGRVRGSVSSPAGDRPGWEQGAHRPDKAAQVLLTVIAKDPDAVARALES